MLKIWIEAYSDEASVKILSLDKSHWDFISKIAHHWIVSANFKRVKLMRSMIAAVGQSAYLTSARKRTHFESIALQVV